MKKFTFVLWENFKPCDFENLAVRAKKVNVLFLRKRKVKIVFVTDNEKIVIWTKK